MHFELLQIVPVVMVVGAFLLLKRLAAEPRSKNLTNGELMYPESEEEGR
jgi:hypothetical protein